ncbi:orotate phosphoribosyltransferase [Helicobacter sp. 23-1044]
MKAIRDYYVGANALLEGHFLLSSGKHSKFYLQSAKVLENPQIAEILLTKLAESIKKSNIKIECVCSPAIGGILAGYELARALNTRFIFTERVNGEMTLRRGFSVKRRERVLICEDIITTGGSAMEAGSCISALGGEVVAFASVANRGFCKSVDSDFAPKKECKLPQNLPFFTLENFEFEMFDAESCPMCKNGSVAVKPGSRGN